MKTINVPTNVKIIMDAITNKGFDSFVCGGAVRDSLFGKTPKDWDICTDATPDEMIDIFSQFKTIPTGIKHGTITVLIENEGFEVTTFRTDGASSDNRHPDSVDFVKTIEEDLARRDFTINAMAFNEKRGIVDPFNGEKDIEEKIIRCVGNASERFEEDALRMMRAIRFSAVLGFSIDRDTATAIQEKSELIKSVSAERINAEITKILMSDFPAHIALLHFFGLSQFIFPELTTMFETKQNNTHHVFDVGTHTMVALENSKKDLVVRLAVLLHDTGKPVVIAVGDDGFDHFIGHAKESAKIANEFLTKFRFENQVVEEVVTLISHHDATFDANKKFIRRMLNKLGFDTFIKLLDVKVADVKAQNPKEIERKVNNVNEILKLTVEIMEAQEPFSLKDLAVGGKELMALGMKPSAQMGIALHTLLDAVIENPELNTMDSLIGILKEKGLLNG